MGLEVSTLNIQNIEKRYMEIILRKGDGVVEAFIVVDTGYYSDNVNKKGWVRILSEEIYLYNDLLNILVSMNHTKLGIPVEKVSISELLETLVYGIISGKVPTKAKVTVNTKDAAGELIPSTIKLRYNGVEIYNNPTKVEASHVFTELPVMIGVEIQAEAPGYLPKVTTVGTWYGERTVNMELTPAPTTTTVSVDSTPAENTQTNEPLVG